MNYTWFLVDDTIYQKITKEGIIQFEDGMSKDFDKAMVLYTEMEEYGVVTKYEHNSKSILFNGYLEKKHNKYP